MAMGERPSTDKPRSEDPIGFQVKLLIKPPKCWLRLVSASVFPGCRSTRRIHVDSMFDKSGTSRLVAKLCISQE